MKPHVVCHMISSIDGRILPSRWTRSPDGEPAAWSAIYAEIHDRFESQAWIVGRVTMAEMCRAAPHPPAAYPPPSRPAHFAKRNAKAYAIAVDSSGKLHFDRPDVQGDAVVVLLGREIADAHLAELAADGISYVVSGSETVDLAAMLDTLGRELGIRRLMLEGGGALNGAFIAAGLVDEISILIAPALDGRTAPGIADAGFADFAGKARLSLTSCERLDHGLVHLEYAVRAA
jgi:riboflavin biosynthesis pyrimidine reductase